MTAIAVPPPAEPDGAPRLQSLDILRGIAILGILFMNINDMAGPMYMNMGGDIRMLGWTGADQVAWWLRAVLADGTARCLLEMLFGAGMVILTDRAAARLGRSAVIKQYYWRNIVLFLFGMVHVFVFLWGGDILHTYGLAALVAVWFRRLRPRWLITFGLVMAMLQLVGGSVYVTMSKMQRADVAALTVREHAGPKLTVPEQKRLATFAKQQTARNKSRAEAQAKIVTENKARSGTFRTWAGSAWESFIYMEKMFLEIAFVWEAAGTMLIGAALYKMGILQGARSRRFYLSTTAIAYAVGLGLRAWAAYATTRFDHLPSLAFAGAEIARIATTVGHVGLVNLLLASAGGARVLRPFAAAGRTALSIYVMQTIVTLWVLFPPQGFALYGHMGWATMMLTSLAIDAALLLLAAWWVRHFAIAPVEWAWRSIVARRRLPFRIASQGVPHRQAPLAV